MDETEIAELQSHLRRLHKRSMRSVPPLEGVSRTAARVLRVVARAGGDEGMHPGHIAEALGMTTSNVAAALRELEDAGYIARRRAATDARRITVVLTEHGAGTVAAHRALRVDGLREAIESALTPEEQARLAAVIPLIGRVAAEENQAGNQAETQTETQTGTRAENQGDTQAEADPRTAGHTKHSEGAPED